MLDESSVEVAKSEEFLSLLERSRLWPFFNASYFFRVYGDSVGTNEVAEKFNLLNVEKTLF